LWQPALISHFSDPVSIFAQFYLVSVHESYFSVLLVNPGEGLCTLLDFFSWTRFSSYFHLSLWLGRLFPLVARIPGFLSSTTSVSRRVVFFLLVWRDRQAGCSDQFHAQPGDLVFRSHLQIHFGFITCRPQLFSPVLVHQRSESSCRCSSVIFHSACCSVLLSPARTGSITLTAPARLVFSSGAAQGQ
jgi:hypothetical protein